jgi:hypothetical protein
MHLKELPRYLLPNFFTSPPAQFWGQDQKDELYMNWTDTAHAVRQYICQHDSYQKPLNWTR